MDTEAQGDEMTSLFGARTSRNPDHTFHGVISDMVLLTGRFLSVTAGII